MDAWHVGAGLAIIGPAVGFIIGRLTSGAAGWRNDVDNLQRLYDASVEKIAKLRARNAVLAARVLDASVAEAKRQAQRVAAAKRAGEVSHANRLEREAREAATKAKTHAELAGIVAEKRS